jgi:hypothetical protein
MEVYSTHCCAIEEIHRLSDHPKSEDALRKILATMIGCYPPNSTLEVYYRSIPAFLWFSGVIECKEGRLPVIGGTNFTYGPNFAEFLRKNKLGTVTSGPSQWNRVNHPNHKVKMWVWQPDPKRVVAWWKENGKKQSLGY